MAPPRSTNWVFTLNNYGSRDEDRLLELVSTGFAKYVMWGREKGASGTPHLQGLLVTKLQTTLSALRKRLDSGWHLEMMAGTLEQAFMYNAKDGDVVESGVRPLTPKEKGAKGKVGGAKEKDRWARALEGITNNDMSLVAPQIQICQAKNIAFLVDKAQSDKMKKTARTEGFNLLFTGPTGTGKSLTAREMFDESLVFTKGGNKWWDGYKGEPVVLIEEMNPSLMTCLSYHLKIWVDRYPFTGEVKGGTIKNIRPSLFILTSNYSMEELMVDCPKDLPPMLRRFASYLFVSEEQPGARKLTWHPDDRFHPKPEEIMNDAGSPEQVAAWNEYNAWCAAMAIERTVQEPMKTELEREGERMLSLDPHGFQGFENHRPLPMLVATQPMIEEEEDDDDEDTQELPSTKRMRPTEDEDDEEGEGETLGSQDSSSEDGDDEEEEEEDEE